VTHNANDYAAFQIDCYFRKQNYCPNFLMKTLAVLLGNAKSSE